MEKTNSKKMNFFYRVFKSITNFDTYTQFANEPMSKAIKYLAIFVLIFSIILTTLYVSIFSLRFSKSIKYLNENIENISFRNKNLSYNNNETVIYNGKNNIVPIVIVDTSEEPSIEEYKDKVKLYDYGFILLKDKILVFLSTQATANQFTTISYSDYNIDDMDKEEILDILNNPIIYIYLGVIIFIVEFIQYFVYMILNAIVLAVMGQLISLILRLKMRFSETYKMGIYALTLPTLLELVYIIINTTTGFVIKYFSWMYTTISYIYICVAIIMIKTDFINMQKQLIRIKMEERPQQEQENLEKNDENKDDNKEDKKEDEKEDSPDENNDLKEQTDS